MPRIHLAFTSLPCTLTTKCCDYHGFNKSSQLSKKHKTVVLILENKANLITCLDLGEGMASLVECYGLGLHTVCDLKTHMLEIMKHYLCMQSSS